MRNKFILGIILAIAAAIPFATTASAEGCTSTGFYRDGINMTAALINPTGTVTGTLNATGCNIGVYYDNGVGSVNNANISGANYFGVLVNGDVNTVSVSVTNSSVHDIGESPLNGAQHGVGIYYRALGTGTASGTIRGNTVSNYQKGGIVANGLGTNVTIKGNIVTGQGPVAYIAQNGIQVGYGAIAQVNSNTVTGNSYTGSSTASGGIIVVGGPCYGGAYTVGTQIVGNTVRNNDIGIWLSNIQEGCVSAPLTQTNVKVINNTISNSAFTNGICYQAGVADQGNNDKIINNTISGTGYGPSEMPPCYAVHIDADASFTNNVKVHANSIAQ